jgi:L-aminopeptidase/D-esterase-like protein
MRNQTLTAVPGVRVGHAQDETARTGCTVIIGPFRAAAFVGGFATGTRELDLLQPAHLSPLVDAILLTGGSAFGLAAADGVMQWLEQQGRGFDAGVARVPLVPAAVLFDLAAGSASRRPDAAMGRAACEAATTAPVIEGTAGAGTGATVGKLLGADGAMPGGLGSWSDRAGDYEIGALVAVNALGDVLSEHGEIIAGARLPDGSFVNSMSRLLSGDPVAGAAPLSNTTLAVVGTNAPLGHAELGALARVAASALARRIAPVFTPFDGDIVFAFSTAARAAEIDAQMRLVLGAAAQLVLERAIERAVTVVSRGGTESRRTESRRIESRRSESRPTESD